MLSDHELKTLRALERQLLDDDPDFPRSFDTRARRLGRPHLGMTARVVIAVVMLLAVVLVVAGAPGSALGLVAATGLSWAVWRWWPAAISDNGPRGDRRRSV